MQLIGNLQAEVDAKEQFMHPMVPRLGGWVENVKKFVTEIVDVEEHKGGVSGRGWAWLLHSITEQLSVSLSLSQPSLS